MGGAQAERRWHLLPAPPRSPYLRPPPKMMGLSTGTMPDSLIAQF